MNNKLKNKVLRGVAMLALVAMVCTGTFAVAKATNGNATVIIENVETLNVGSLGSLSGTFKEAALGSTQTTATYATAGSVTNGGGLYLWDTESTSGLEVAGPTHLAALSTSGDLTSSSNTRAASLVQTGALATFATTTSATAAQVCNNPVWNSASNGVTTTTLTLPSTTTLFADCLTTNGDSITFSVINTDSVTSTVLAAGAGGTALYESSLTIAAGKAAIVRVVRDATATYKALIVSLDN